MTRRDYRLLAFAMHQVLCDAGDDNDSQATMTRLAFNGLTNELNKLCENMDKDKFAQAWRYGE